MSRSSVSSSFHRILAGACLLGAFQALGSAQIAAPVAVTGARVTGTIDLLEINNPNDVWSGGKMVVNGQVIVLPRNLLIDLPANRLTLQQLFAEAPPEALALGVSGLATLDGLGIAGVATVLGNRTRFGNVIAGEVLIEKGQEVANGTITYIDHTDGYFMMDGIIGDPTTGLMVRINDPSGRHTIQSGRGCAGGPNCSADPRFGLDPDNYTITFSTGYPAGLPSTVPAAQRPGAGPGDVGASDANGVGDPFCPATNRTTNPVLDSTRFAPLQVGDSVTAEGNLEFVGDEYFLSAHTLTCFAGLITRDDPTQPDYMIFDEVEWDAPAFQNQRARLLLIGFTTLNASQVDCFALHVDPLTNSNHEVPLASTVGNPTTVNQGIIAGGGGIFKIRYDVDFIAPTNKPDLLPCNNLANAGFPPCTNANSILENFNRMMPLSRELQGRSRHILNPGVITRDINGNQATNGQYLTPIGVGFPEFVEIDLAALQTPFSFDGITWNLDRRLGPGGCDGPCEGTPQPLSPFPVSNINPSFTSPGGNARLLGFFPFGAGNVLAWPPIEPVALPILPTPKPTRNIAPAPVPVPVADFALTNSSGTAPLIVSFTNNSTDTSVQLWDFGDGTFSTDANPVHTFTTPGAFDVTLTALGQGGLNTVTRGGAVVATPPGGPTAPTASFTASATAGNAPLTVNFTDTSVGDVTSWSWSFGDGGTSSVRNPSHVYTVPGLYTVSMTASGPGGSDTSIRLNLISANQAGGLTVDFIAIDPTTGAAPLRVRFRAINVTGVATTGTFDFGDGTTGTVAAGNGRIAHTYAAPGTYTVTLSATDGTNSDVVQKVGFITVQ